MSLKFISLYGLVVMLTVLFFQFIPAPEMLSWEEVLLSKLLNQMPALLCVVYMIFQRRRIKNATLYYLLLGFLLINIISEIYFYLMPEKNQLIANVLNNGFMYIALILLYSQMQSQRVERVANRKTLLYATGAGVVFGLGFLWSAMRLLQEHFQTNQPLVVVVLFTMLTTIMAVCSSFFVDKLQSRNWYRVIAGTMALTITDIYVYVSIFILKVFPVYSYTIGKVFFSIGLMLIVDRLMRKCLHKETYALRYGKVSKPV